MQTTVVCIVYNYDGVAGVDTHAHMALPHNSVEERGAYNFVHDDLPRQHPFGTTLGFTGPVSADSRQQKPSVRKCGTR